MKKIALSQADWALIRNFLTGGAAIGAGAGMVTSLANQLSDTKREADEKSVQDKDQLKVVLQRPPTKLASWLRGPAAMTGALLAGGASYAAVRAIHQAIKKKELEKQLQQSQTAYLNVLDDESQGEKRAAAVERKGMGIGEVATSVPLSVALLVGLSSAALANQALKRTFPDRKSGLRMTPRRVVVERQEDADPEPEGFEVVPTEKLAAARALLYETVAGFRTGQSDTEDFLAATAAGRFDELTKVASVGDVFSIFDAAKGAAHVPVSDLRIKLASMRIANDYSIAHAVEVMAAAEFLEHSPMLFKLAAALPLQTQRELIAFGIKTAEQHSLEFVVPAIEQFLELHADKSAAMAAPQMMPEVLDKLLAPQQGLPTGNIPGIPAESLQSTTSQDSGVAAPLAA